MQAPNGGNDHHNHESDSRQCREENSEDELERHARTVSIDLPAASTVQRFAHTRRYGPVPF
jgi:hypothetical protein